MQNYYYYYELQKTQNWFYKQLLPNENETELQMIQFKTKTGVKECKKDSK